MQTTSQQLQAVKGVEIFWIVGSLILRHMSWRANKSQYAIPLFLVMV